MDLSRRSLFPIAAAAAQAQTAPQQNLPNILFLISDDHTAADLGCYGNTHIHTPHLDRMAAQGARFTNCSVSSAQCSPNRSSIFTGCTPHTTSTSRLHTPMPGWEPSFLEPLKQKGYFTGAFRKVHQGNEFNNRFDYYSAAKTTPFSEFFDKLPANRPFFLHIGFTDPHRLYVPGAFHPPHDPAKVRLPAYLPDSPEIRQDLAHYHDFIARMDAECGTIFDLLERRGLASNTLVLFTGDNGMPFPGAKGTCYDPGLQVPLLAKWPGRIQAGMTSDQLIAHVDLPSTFLDAAGLTQSKKMQGRSFLPLLTGKSYSSREAVFSERNWHDNFDPVRSVRTKDYKLIFNAAPHFPYRPAWDLADSPTWASYQRLARLGKLQDHHLRLLQPDRPVIEMYHLPSDPGEFNNIADDPAHAQQKQKLLKLLSDWMHDTYDYLPPAFARPGEPQGRGWPISL